MDSYPQFDPHEPDPDERVPLHEGDPMLAKLRDIARCDPDGELRSSPPTEADHERHRAWAVAEYGEQVWTVYRRGGWDPRYVEQW